MPVAGMGYNGTVEKGYKYLASICHPDKNPKQQKLADDTFKRLGEWRVKAMAKIARGKYGSYSVEFEPVSIHTKTTTYTLDEVLDNTGSIANIYHADVAPRFSRSVIAKVVRSPKNNDLMLSESRTLRQIHDWAVREDYKTILHFIPEIIDTFEISGKEVRRVNILPHYDHHVTLAQVIKAYPEGLPLADAAWMINRFLTALSLCHTAGFVHTAVLPEHIMVSKDPDDHHGALIGWGHSVKAGEKIRALASHRGRYYPPEIHGGDFIARTQTDVNMAARCIEQLVEIRWQATIQPILNACYLHHSRRIISAAQLQCDFSDVLKRFFGKPKFRRFEMTKLKQT